MTKSKDSQRLFLDLVEAWNAHDTDRVASFYHPSYSGEDVGQPIPEHGPQGVRQTIERYLHAFPDITFTLDDSVIAGNRAVLAWTARGTHLGELMKIPATGRVMQVRGVSLFTVGKGKITKALHMWDLAGLLRAIRLLPEL